MKYFLAIWIALSFNAVAKELPKFPVNAIPEDLKKDVDAVIREDQMIFTVHSKSRATYKIYQVITILNANAKHYASEIIGYDKLSKIVSLRAAIYDANGESVKKLKPSEIYDQSAFDGFSLYSDNRIKSIDLSYGVYPYTVEIEYEIEFKYLFHIPSFYLLSGEKTSIQHSFCQFIYLKSIAPRFNTVAIDQEPKKESINTDQESLTWEFNNLRPMKGEVFSPSYEKIVPHINAAPSVFEYDGYQGTMNSWDEFGSWINSLNKGRDILPEATKQKIKHLTAEATSDEEKVRILYEYLQNKTRYVSIQLGIGGFQPFEASVVDQTGYGDCKALSNYMVAMLKEVGVKANYVLIYAGDQGDELNTQFPSSQFNHAIAAVPGKKDTLWLECTSQTNPFNYQGKFTGNRKALMITDDGAKIVNTHQYPAEVNVQRRTADVYVTNTGDATAKVSTAYKGLQYENARLNFVLDDQYDNQKKWVLNNTQIPTFDLVSFKMKNHKDEIPTAVVDLDLSLRKFASTSGKRLFLTPNLMNRSSFIPEKLDQRKTNVVLRTPYIDIDTIRYHVPEEIYPESLPEPVVIKSAFGEYEARYIVDQGSIVYIRRMKRNKGEFAPETYNDLINFYRAINKADNTKIVFLNKT